MNATDNDNSTALIMAAWGNSNEDAKDAEIVNELLQKGADPIISELTGLTALSCAAKNGKSQCLSVLIKAIEARRIETPTTPTAAEPGQQGNSVCLALHEQAWVLLKSAIASGVTDCVRVILENPSYRNAITSRLNSSRATPGVEEIEECVLNNFTSSEKHFEMENTLREYKIISDSIIKHKNEAFWHSKPDILMKMAKSGSLDILYDILKNHNKIANLQDRGGCSVLMWTVFSELNNENELKDICDQVNIESIKLQDTSGCNMIMWAARKGNHQYLEILLHRITEAGATEKAVKSLLNAQDLSGMTALMWAAWKRKKKCLEVLLKINELDLTIKDNQGYTVLDWAARGGCEECVILLVNHGAKFGRPDWESEEQ